MRTYSAKPSEVTRDWFVVDASEFELGRLATRLAMVLRGRHKPTYTPHVDTGDFVVVINADKFILTGNKREQKRYYHHTGTIGHLRETTVDRLQADKPGEVVKRAIAGMMPKTKMGKKMLSKLKVYAGSEHPHSAQGPTPLDLNSI